MAVKGEIGGRRKKLPTPGHPLTAGEQMTGARDVVGLDVVDAFRQMHGPEGRQQIDQSRLASDPLRERVRAALKRVQGHLDTCRYHPGPDLAGRRIQPN